MILSAQTIRKLCLEKNMIEPFIERQVINGRSAGLSACSYDVRIAQNITLQSVCDYGFHDGSSQLASTIEKFNIPDNVCGFVVDKSSFARLFMTAFNTLLDPGWRGTLTLELVNLGTKPIVLKAGEPICQIVFHYLDEHTCLPYQGKYQDQEDRPVPAIFEK